MVFSSLVFLCIFLPIVFLGHTILPGIRAKNAMLLLASLVFYAYGEPVYVVLMVASALCNYLFALWIERFQDQKKWIVSVAVILNLALLVIFNYAGFLTEREYDVRDGISGSGHPSANRYFLFHVSGDVLRDRCVSWGKQSSEKFWKSAFVHILFPTADRRSDRQISRC